MINYDVLNLSYVLNLPLTANVLYTHDKTGFLHSNNTDVHNTMTKQRLLFMQSVKVCSMQLLKTEQNKLYQPPPVAVNAFDGNLEAREDADASRKQPCLPCSFNRGIVLLIG